MNDDQMGLAARRRETGPAIAMSAIGLAWLAAAAFMAAGGGEGARRSVADLVPPLLDLGATGLAFLASRGAGTRRAAAAWAVVGLAMVVYAVGDGLFAWYDIGLHAAPFPSAADVAYVAYYPIMVAALLSFPTTPADRREKLRLAIDSAIVVIGGGMVVWQSILLPALGSIEADPIATALALGYPVGDLVLLFGLATIALRRPAGVDRRALVALVGGLLLMLVADVGYGQVSLEGSGSSEHWTDVLYMASTVAIAAAGFLQLRSRSSAATDGAAGSIPRPLLYLPYLAIAAGFGTLFVTAVVGPGRDALLVLLVGVVVLTVLVLVRQETILRENSRLLAERARREAEARFRSLAGQSLDAITLVTPEGMVVDATDGAGRILGLEAASLIGRPIVSLAHADDAPRLAGLIADAAGRRKAGKAIEWRLWDGNGVWRQVETNAANLVDDPSVGQLVLTTRDVRERKALEQRVQQVAVHDLLTGLANRALFLDRLDRALSGAREGRGGTVVLALNIDGFKRLNDSLGQPAGDRILQEVARRLGGAIRSADECARLAGDEFGVLLGGGATEEEGRAVAGRILTALHAPIAVAQTTLQLTARVGIAASRASGDGATALLRQASVAMSHARDAGRDGVAVFEPEMQEALEGRLELEGDLRRALERDELLLQYQPIMDLASGEFVAAEALVRWDHPTRGRLAPGVFIPLAEETDLIDQIGSWVLRTACEEVARWARLSRSRVPRVSVNLSPHQLADPELPWTIQATLGQAGAVPGWLSLEVTEGLLLAHTEAVLERLHAIRSLGISISLDDFGTGYSSLAYLQRFPLSQIKIDRSFVIPLDDPGQEPGVVRAIVEIGRALGMATVAEGIETTTQLERLRALGCDLGQGYLLARPLDREVMADLVANPPRPDWARGSGSLARTSRRRLVVAAR